jgi:hypothetical protein
MSCCQGNFFKILAANYLGCRLVFRTDEYRTEVFAVHEIGNFEDYLNYIIYGQNCDKQQRERSIYWYQGLIKKVQGYYQKDYRDLSAWEKHEYRVSLSLFLLLENLKYELSLDARNTRWQEAHPLYFCLRNLSGMEAYFDGWQLKLVDSMPFYPNENGKNEDARGFIAKPPVVAYAFQFRCTLATQEPWVLGKESARPQEMRWPGKCDQQKMRAEGPETMRQVGTLNQGKRTIGDLSTVRLNDDGFAHKIGEITDWPLDYLDLSNNLLFNRSLVAIANLIRQNKGPICMDLRDNPAIGKTALDFLAKAVFNSTRLVAFYYDHPALRFTGDWCLNKDKLLLFLIKTNRKMFMQDEGERRPVGVEVSREAKRKWKRGEGGLKSAPKLQAIIEADAANAEKEKSDMDLQDMGLDQASGDCAFTVPIEEKIDSLLFS